MRVLVIGAGAREHALCWKLRQEPGVDALFRAPGNAGIARSTPCLSLNASRPAEVVALAAREAIALTIVGPEAPLTAGVVDAMTAAGHRACGPTQGAAAIQEGDCDPWAPGMTIQRRYTANHTYRYAGVYRIKITLRHAGKSILSQSLSLTVRAGLGDTTPDPGS